MKRDRPLNGADPRPSCDDLSSDPRGPGHPVEPYRDSREALLARRQALSRELTDAERAAERRDGLAEQLERLDSELRGHAAPWLDAIAITTPCKEPWERMRGGDAVRRCGRCHREVHDLSKMARAQIDDLFERAAQTPCVRLRRRRDGTIVTADCPTRAPSRWARAASTVATGVLFGTGFGAAAAVLGAGLPSRVAHEARVQVRPPAPGVRGASIERRAPRVRLGAFRSEEPEDDEDGYLMGEPILTPRPTAPPRSTASEGVQSDDLTRRVRWIAPQAWEIDRELIHAVRDRYRGVHRGGGFTMIPEEREGRVIGMSLWGIRERSLGWALGLRNADVVMDVNGQPLSPPAGMARLYQRARREDALFVRLRRDGEERVHVYRVIDR